MEENVKETLQENLQPLDYAKALIETIMRKYEAGALPPEGHFHYHQGVFLSGIYQNYLLCEDERYFQYMKQWVDAMLDEDGTIRDYGSGHLDDIQPGNLLFPLYERTKEQKYRRTLDHLAELVRNFPRNAEGGFWHMDCFAGQMWLDGLYMAGPFSVHYAAAFQSPELFDSAAKQALLMEKKTKDPVSGLWYHAWDSEKKEEWADKNTGLSPEFWGRSIGWIPVAVLDELDWLPKDHEAYPELVRLVKELLEAVCNYQSEDGRWYQVVNKGGQLGNWLENSCSCLFSAAIFKAVRKNILSSEYEKLAWRGYEGVIRDLNWDGDDLLVGNVCIGTGVGNYEHYCNRPVSTNDLHGAGAFLLMCAQAQQGNSQISRQLEEKS